MPRFFEVMDQGDLLGHVDGVLASSLDPEVPASEFREAAQYLQSLVVDIDAKRVIVKPALTDERLAFIRWFAEQSSSAPQPPTP